MLKKQRILLVIRWPVGGIRTFIRYVYNRFDQTGYELTIIAPDVEELRILLTDLQKFDITYVQANKNVSNIRLVYLITKTLFNKRFDLVHSQGFTSGLCAALPARLRGIKHLMTSHDVLLTKQFGGIIGWLKHKTVSTILRKIKFIHSVSRDAHENLIEFFPILRRSGTKLYVIPNGIDVERFRTSIKRNLRLEHNLPSDTFLIGFLGRFMSQKGFMVLVDAMAELTVDVGLRKKAVVVTFGFGGFIREDKEYVKKKGLNENFRFLPFEANVAPSLKGLDLLAMPSLWEACGLLAMEAMVAGVPVIGTDCIGLREVLIDTPSVVVHAADSKALADAIANEIASPSRKKAESFTEEAAMRFDVTNQAKAVMGLISEIIGNPHQ